MREIVRIVLSVLSFPVRLARYLGQKVVRWGWRQTLLTLVIVLILTLVGLTLLAEATSQPAFCVTCHYMKPYFASWRESSHKDVPCTMCHFPPGIQHAVRQKFTAISMVVNYITGIYKRSKPWAEISDESCLRPGCHDTRLLQGRVLFKEGIIFDHGPHLLEMRLGKKLRCTSCHSQIVQGAHISVTETSCFLCHFKGDPSGHLSRCTRCHDAPVRTPANPNVSFDHGRVIQQKVACNRCHGPMQVGSGAVTKDRCSTCHAELGHIEQFHNTELVHRIHITEHKVECLHCHQEILHQSVSRTEEVKPSCEDCHPGFHQVQVDLFTGKGGYGVEEHPSTMFLSGLNCRGCHNQPVPADNFPEKGYTFKASGVVCSPCHDEGYARILEGWKKGNRERIRQIKEIYQTVAQATRSLTGDGKIKADSLLKVSLYNIEMVELGHGVHNIPYAEALLGAAYRQLKEAYHLAQPKASLPPFEVGLPSGSENCMNCHYGVETMVVQRATRPFPHSPHVLTQKLSCTQCHDNRVKHGSLILSQDECNRCHHQSRDQKAPDCAQCHKLQASLYGGDQEWWGPQAKADAMSEAGMVCTDCHATPQGTIRRPDGTLCAECHDESYGSLIEQWHQETKALLIQADSLLHLCRNIDLPEIRRVRTRLERITQDRSVGVHNHALVVSLLKGDIAFLEEFVTRHGLGLSPRPEPPALPSPPQ